MLATETEAAVAETRCGESASMGFTSVLLLVAGWCQQEAAFFRALGTRLWLLLLALLGNSYKPISNTPKEPPQKAKTTGE